MKIVDVVQGSPEWFAARVGRATSSNFAAILAKGEGKTRLKYLHRVVSERLTGLPAETFSNDKMERGILLEPDARLAYERRVGTMVHEVGLILHDDLMVSGSPDFLEGEEGGGEIKSVIPTTQLATILSQKMPTEHIPQVQGNLWVSGRKWWKFVSYCPEMPRHMQLFVCTIQRDEVYISTKLVPEVKIFLEDVQRVLDQMETLCPREDPSVTDLRSGSWDANPDPLPL